MRIAVRWTGRPPAYRPVAAALSWLFPGGAAHQGMTTAAEQFGHCLLVGYRTRPGDRRAVLIELTSSGHVTAATIRQAIADLEHRALGSLPADALTCLRTALQALTEVSS